MRAKIKGNERRLSGHKAFSDTSKCHTPHSLPEIRDKKREKEEKTLAVSPRSAPARQKIQSAVFKRFLPASQPLLILETASNKVFLSELVEGGRLASLSP